MAAVIIKNMTHISCVILKANMSLFIAKWSFMCRKYKKIFPMIAHCMFKKWEHVYFNLLYGVITHLISKYFFFFYVI